jgi:putative hydrolase of the HAD superfamily
MTGPVDAVLFDLDDTLCTYERSADDILALAFERVRVDPFFDGAEYVDRLSEFTESGEDIRDTRRAAFGTFAVEAGHGEPLGEEIADIYAAERDQTNVRYLDGAQQALDALAEDYRVGMVTNGDPWMQSQKLAGLGIEDRFEVTVHGGHDAPYKPDPEPFHIALGALGVEADRAVHVGNSLSSDVTGAHAAGLRSVWLADGDTLDPEPSPHHVVDSLRELVDEPWA